MRGSSAIAVAQPLMDAGVAVAAIDHEGMEQAHPLRPEVTICAIPFAAIEGADLGVIVTAWDAVRALDLKRVKDLLNARVMVGPRNICKLAVMHGAGFNEVSLKRF